MQTWRVCGLARDVGVQCHRQPEQLLSVWRVHRGLWFLSLSWTKSTLCSPAGRWMHAMQTFLNSFSPGFFRGHRCRCHCHCQPRVKWHPTSYTWKKWRSVKSAAWSLRSEVVRPELAKQREHVEGPDTRRSKPHRSRSLFSCYTHYSAFRTSFIYLLIGGACIGLVMRSFLTAACKHRQIQR